MTAAFEMALYVAGPPRAERSAVKHVARIGQDVKLKCAIDAYPAPLFSWSKEGETIDFTWDRQVIRLVL
jgi:Immunoglobulin I-set domain